MMKRKSVSQLGAVQLEGTINNNQDILQRAEEKHQNALSTEVREAVIKQLKHVSYCFIQQGFIFRSFSTFLTVYLSLRQVYLFPFVKKLGRYHLANYIERNTYSIPGIDVGDIHEGIVIRQRFPSVDEFHLKSNQNRTSRIRN